MKLNEISDFKKREIEYELRNEPPNNYAVYINDRKWKVVSNRQRAERMAQTLRNKGKDAKVHVTGEPVSETSEAKRNPVKKNMDKFHKPKTHKDMKAAQKRGYEKHKAKELQEGPVVARGEGHLHDLVDNMMDGWFEAKSRTREELEKVLNAIGKTITGDAERLVIDNIGKAEDYSIEEKKTKQRLDPKCWKGYKKQGTKMKGGVRVNNCVPK